jgi:3-methyladenine DNA glycosylase AlkD
MNADFFANYKDFMVFPDDDEYSPKEEFIPQIYQAHYIITLSLVDSLISSWVEAAKLDIDLEKSLQKVIGEWNRREKRAHNMQLLELKEDTTYLVLALSFKTRIENDEEVSKKIETMIQKEFTNSLFIGERWYTLVGEQGKKHRRLFKLLFKEYTG